MSGFGACVRTLLEGKGPFCQESFVNGEEARKRLLESKVLVVGAGGLGCELLKSLALTGFRNIHVVDLDTIEVSNLNRQFLFRKKDVGRPKAEVAAEFVRNRVAGVNVVGHCCRVEDLAKDGLDFYRQFNVVFGGLDSLPVRLWLSDTLCAIAAGPNGKVIPYIDGGTEEWKGHVKVIFPGQSACMRCQEELFVPPRKFASCTVASKPRSPEHCVIYASELLWPRDRPGDKLDGDNDEHIQWLMERAREHAIRFNLEPPDFRRTRTVVKNTIAAIASTQAIVASMCVTEALKIVTGAGPCIDNNLQYSGGARVFMTNFRFERAERCDGCRTKRVIVPKVDGETVAQFMERIKNDYNYPVSALRTEAKTIYQKIMRKTRENLDKPIVQFVADGEDIIVQAPGQDPMQVCLA